MQLVWVADSSLCRSGRPSSGLVTTFVCSFRLKYGYVQLQCMKDRRSCRTLSDADVRLGCSSQSASINRPRGLSTTPQDHPLDPKVHAHANVLCAICRFYLLTCVQTPGHTERRDPDAFRMASHAAEGSQTSVTSNPLNFRRPSVLKNDMALSQRGCR